MHKKTDKRSTWAYHLVNGWYLETSPENYCTHLCQITTINRERLTDAAQFSHKSITKPTITHVDKITADIADCTKAIKNMGDINGANKMQKLLQLTERAFQHYPAIMEASTLAPRITANLRVTQPDPRVPPSGNQTQRTGVQHRWLVDDSNNRCETRAMTQEAQPVPRVDQPAQLVQEALPRNNK